MFEFKNLNVKEKIRKAVAVGVAAITLGVSGDVGVRQVLTSTTTENKEKISSVENSQSKEKIKKLEKELLEKYEKAQKAVGDLDQKFFLEKDPKYNAEKVRNELRKHINSPEYLDKLKIEFGGDSEKAKNIQNDRLEYLNKVKINFVDYETMRNKYLMPTWVVNNIKIPQWLSGVLHKITSFDGILGFYNREEHEIVLLKKRDDYTTRHELFHASTKGNTSIPEKTKEFF